MTPCAVPDCGRRLAAAGLCQRHYERRRNGDPAWAGPIRPKQPNPPVCVVAGCYGRPRSHGLCSPHESQFYRGVPVAAMTARAPGDPLRCATCCEPLAGHVLDGGCRSDLGA